MQKITIYLILLLSLVSVSMPAQQTEAMNVQKTAGEDQSILLEKIKNIEFANDALVFVTTSGVFQIGMDDIRNIVWGKYNGGITTDVSDIQDNDFEVSLLNDVVSIKSKHSIYALYLMDITGKMIAAKKPSSVNDAQITIPQSGAFILFLETSQGYIARKIVNN